MEKELQHQGLTELIVTENMAQRKEKMLELGDLFLAFPGGIGTLEEISEIMSLNKLDMVSKPFAFLDYEGYWQPMRALLDRMGGRRVRVERMGGKNPVHQGSGRTGTVLQRNETVKISSKGFLPTYTVP